jgi:hypothetical protein
MLVASNFAEVYGRTMSQTKAQIPPIPARLIERIDPVECERQLVEAEAETEAGHGIPGGEVECWLLG